MLDRVDVARRRARSGRHACMITVGSLRAVVGVGVLMGVAVLDRLLVVGVRVVVARVVLGHHARMAPRGAVELPHGWILSVV